ncbi:MAG: tRNA 2-thiouridine(34) synthase MnmA [Bacteroidales bacterium]|nr:tRNA 2-thiouridine(34) synthase MnmA [Bacteroidales bacterium]
MSNERILLGMSGGIDSTAACLMLQEQGFEVVGMTLLTSDHTNAESAVEVAHKLSIEHYVVDARQEFHDIVIQPFTQEYLQGRTPNPCVRCNSLFKERLLCVWADRTHCQRVATGHYCRLQHTGDYWYVRQAADTAKDQSYFLWQLPQHVLCRLCFPLGGLTKQQVRQYLHDKGFEAKAHEGESMEVCFIPTDYRDFLRKECPDIDRRIGPGRFVNKQGVTIGTHEGFPFYTIGQRKGLRIALGDPAYVLRINAEKNTVMLGTSADLEASFMVCQLPQGNTDLILHHPQLTVRIRYRSQALPCHTRLLVDGRLLVRFLAPASAITPGQSAVFYADDCVAGGAFIDSQRGILKLASENNDL